MSTQYTPFAFGGAIPHSRFQTKTDRFHITMAILRNKVNDGLFYIQTGVFGSVSRAASKTQSRATKSFRHGADALRSRWRKIDNQVESWKMRVTKDLYFDVGPNCTRFKCSKKELKRYTNHFDDADGPETMADIHPNVFAMFFSHVRGKPLLVPLHGAWLGVHPCIEGYILGLNIGVSSFCNAMMTNIKTIYTPASTNRYVPPRCWKFNPMLIIFICGRVDDDDELYMYLNQLMQEPWRCLRFGVAKGKEAEIIDYGKHNAEDWTRVYEGYPDWFANMRRRESKIKLGSIKKSTAVVEDT